MTQMHQGFTLLEVLLAIALIGIVVGIGAPVYQSAQVRNDADVAVSMTVHSLRRAQALARAVQSDTSWGVHATSGVVTLFQGADFVSRDTDFDEVFEIATNMDVNGVDEVVFATLSGEPDVTGDIVLTRVDGATSTITINEFGMIDF